MVEQSCATGGGNLSFDFSSRAAKLKTLGGKRRCDADLKLIDVQSQGLTKMAYWKQHVKNKEQALKFYDLYYPEYIPALRIAMVDTLDSIFKKCAKGEPLTPEDTHFMKRFSQSKTEHVSGDWCLETEVEKHIEHGKMALAIQRLDDLMK